MDMQEALDSIEGSSDWRYDLVLRAFDEWQSTLRTVLIGRGVYAYTGEDTLAMVLDPTEGVMMSALLRGATHNTIADLLLISGVVGLLLFYAVYFAFVFGIYAVLKARKQLDFVGLLCVIAIISTLIHFIIGLFGGGWLWQINALLGAVIVCLASGEGAQHHLQTAHATLAGDASVNNAATPSQFR
jgi:O-antigen ligase